MAQVVKHLPSKCQTPDLEFKLQHCPKKRKRGEEGRGREVKRRGKNTSNRKN
jgi:hypothetical protein